MKKYSLFLLVIFLISTLSFQQVSGQDKKSDKDKDIKMQQSIEQQKKAMSEQKKAMEDSDLEWIERSDDPEKAQEDIDNAGSERAKIFMNLPRGNRSFNFDEPMIYTGDGLSGFYGHMGNAERTTWDFSKTVKDNTFSSDYTFDVEKTSKSVVMSVVGDCKTGDIHIKIIMPNGKIYSDILIDESGNLNWRKSFTISETQNRDKTGGWKFQISSTKATGYFKISLQAY